LTLRFHLVLILLATGLSGLLKTRCLQTGILDISFSRMSQLIFCI